ncbi:MAG TPA: YraN family protein [Pyrinomonadaceae bacterium]|jgi:putative endonuclease|nr:YraN family protein [Pyrinomonadaceae bacterium]
MNTLFPQEPQVIEDPNRVLGRKGERLAVRFLEKGGARMVAANFRIPIGRNIKGVAVNAEIDLIVMDGATLCFIEVKTRSSDEFAAPEEAVNLRKQRQIIRAAKKYRKIFRLNNVNFRYDVISIVLRKQAPPRIDHFKSFWTEEKFRKDRWSDDDFSGF